MDKEIRYKQIAQHTNDFLESIKIHVQEDCAGTILTALSEIFLFGLATAKEEKHVLDIHAAMVSELGVALHKTLNHFEGKCDCEGEKR